MDIDRLRGYLLFLESLARDIREAEGEINKKINSDILIDKVDTLIWFFTNWLKEKEKVMK